MGLVQIETLKNKKKMDIEGQIAVCAYLRKVYNYCFK